MSSGDALVEVIRQPADDAKKQPSASENANFDVEKEIGAREKEVNVTLEKHAHDEDEAMKAVDEMNGELVEVDEQTNKRLLRTIDYHLMPIMCMVYAMNFLDSTIDAPRKDKKLRNIEATDRATRNRLVVRVGHGDRI